MYSLWEYGLFTSLVDPLVVISSTTQVANQKGEQNSYLQYKRNMQFIFPWNEALYAGLPWPFPTSMVSLSPETR